MCRKRPRKARYLPLFDRLLSPFFGSDQPSLFDPGFPMDDLHQRLLLLNRNSVANLRMKAVDYDPFGPSR